MLAVRASVASLLLLLLACDRSTSKPRVDPERARPPAASIDAAAAPAPTPPTPTPPPAAAVPADPPPPVRTWDASAEHQTRTLLEVLRAGDLDALLTAPIAEPFVVEVTPNKAKKRVLTFATRAALVACLKDTCAGADDVFQHEWQIYAAPAEDKDDVPAPLTCRPAKPAGTTCCAIDAASIADFAPVPTRTCATGGKLARLVVEQDGF